MTLLSVTATDQATICYVPPINAMWVKMMSRFVVEVVEPGCDCCSYVTVDSFDTEAEIPDKYRTSAYDIYDTDEDDE